MLIDILTDMQGWFFEESLSIDDNPEVFSPLEDIDPPIDLLLVEVDGDADSLGFAVDDAYPERTNIYLAEQTADVYEFSGFGNPVADAQFWEKQNGSSSCAVMTQTNIFESITGERIPEDIACQIAQEKGWFDPEIGTRPGDVGKLLNELGIPTEQKYNATLEDIANALEKGDRPIVALDANEIWTPIRDTNGMPLEQTNAGHAVWITGIETQADGSVKIVLNDSGHSNGKMASVDALDFLNAWEDHSNFLVVADAPDQTVVA
jgi:hypothetical protein